MILSATLFQGGTDHPLFGYADTLGTLAITTCFAMALLSLTRREAFLPLAPIEPGPPYRRPGRQTLRSKISPASPDQPAPRPSQLQRLFQRLSARRGHGSAGGHVEGRCHDPDYRAGCRLPVDRPVQSRVQGADRRDAERLSPLQNTCRRSSWRKSPGCTRKRLAEFEIRREPPVRTPHSPSNPPPTPLLQGRPTIDSTRICHAHIHRDRTPLARSHHRRGQHRSGCVPPRQGHSHSHRRDCHDPVLGRVRLQA